MTTTNEPVTVRVTHRYSASPERVFDAWLDPAKIGKWMLAPSKDDQILHIRVDARVGGSFSFLVRRAGHEIDHIGEYLEIDRPRRLVFTWDAVDRAEAAPARPGADASVVRIDFAPAGTGTELRLTHERVPKEYADRTQAGWSMILAALGDQLAG